MGDDCGPLTESAGCGVEAVLFSVESAAMGVATPIIGQSADGDEGIIRLFRDICSILRRQLATISSPRRVPKVSTF